MNLLYEGIRWLIEFVYGICGDYGIAIVVITIIIRLCMIPLNRKQKQTMGSMGCLLSLLQFPIMIILYNGIRLAIVADVTTVLLPWVPSLLARDGTYILPAITVVVQMLPQILPYIGYFKSLNLAKMSMPMLLILLFTNGWFATMIPAGTELYYMISGLLTAVEQVIVYIVDAKKINRLSIEFGK